MSAQERYIPSSRAEAKALGLKTYYTGHPCKRGNVAERYTNSANCLCKDCYQEFLSSTNRWREKNRETLLKSRRDNYSGNRIDILQKQKEWRENNHDEAVAGQARYREVNRVAIREKARRHGKENPIRVLTLSAKRRATKMERLPTWFGEFDSFIMAEASDLARLRTAATGIPWHVDHMIPLRAKNASGLHCGHNLQVVPAYLNLRKKNKLWLHEPDQWISALCATAASV